MLLQEIRIALHLVAISTVYAAHAKSQKALALLSFQASPHRLLADISRMKDSTEARKKRRFTKFQTSKIEMSVEKFEALDDVADLVSFADGAHKGGLNVTATWPPEAVLRIIAPLLNRPPKDWPCESRRIELLERLLVDETSAPRRVREFLQGPLLKYHTHWRVPSKSCLWQAHVTHSLNSILPIIKPMVDKPSKEWTGSEVEAAVQLLGGGPSLDGREATPEADDAWWQFVDKWSDFLCENPAVKRRVDPFWVFIDVLGAAPPPALAGVLARFPPVAGAAVGAGPGLNGSPYVLPFGTRDSARHFIGWLQGSVPGLRAWLTSNVVAPVYY